MPLKTHFAPTYETPWEMRQRALRDRQRAAFWRGVACGVALVCVALVCVALFA